MESRKRSETQEFHDWLKKNEYQLQDTTPQEIAKIAILVGFDPALVHQWTAQERFRRMEKAS